MSGPDPARLAALGLKDDPIVASEITSSEMPFMSYEIQPEAAGDKTAIADLIEKSFGPERTKRTVHQFRIDREPVRDLCFVGRADGVMVASIRFWLVALPSGRQVPMLGPLAVDPALRGYGVGRTLVRHALDAVQSQGHAAVLIVGDPGYYAGFGFSVAAVRSLDMPGPVGPLTFMGLEFTDGALTGENGIVTRTP